MACSISINSVEGIQDPSSSEILKIIVKGEASLCLEVQVSISNVLTSSVVHVQVVEVISGNWEAVWELEDMGSPNFDTNQHFISGEYICGNEIKTLKASCKEHPECKDVTHLDLFCKTDEEPNPSCPEVQLELTMGDCVDGIRTVFFEANFVSANEGVFQWEYNEGDLDGIAFIPPPDPNTGLRTITGTGTYETAILSAATVKLHLLFQPNLTCVTELTFEIENCEPPPPKDCDTNTSLVVTEMDSGKVFTDEDCLPPGIYIVEVSEPDEPGLNFLWFENGLLLQGFTGKTLEVTLSEGEEKSISVIIQKENCIWNPTIDLADCTKRLPCPEVAPIQVDISDKCENDSRNVDISITMTGEANQPLGAEVELIGPDDSVISLDSDSGTGELSLGSSQILAAGDYNIRVNITDPANCGSHSQKFTVAPCESIKPPSDLVIDLCLLLRVFAMLGFAFLVLGLVLLLCPVFSWFSPEVTMIIGGVMAAAGAVFFIGFGLAWVIFCKPGPCDYLMIVWQMFIVAGAVFTYAAFCPTCGYLGFGVIGLAIGFGLYIWWVFKCRPTVCKSLIEWFVLILFVLDVVMVVEIILGSCVLTTNWWTALIWAATLIAFKAFLVFQMRERNCSIGF